MSFKPTAPFLFIIDTEDYAGNFERELCAYVTGRLGECDVGDDMAKLFEEETKLKPFENVIDEGDEHGCRRPVTIYATPGWFNHGMGEHFKDTPEDEVRALEAYRKAIKAYHGNSCYHGYLKEWQKGKTKEYIDAGWTEEKLKKACKDEEKEIEKANALKKVSKYPSYQSVAILFEKKPTKKQIDLMKSRAALYSAMPKETYGAKVKPELRISKIIGFRLIKQVVEKKILSQEFV